MTRSTPRCVRRAPILLAVPALAAAIALPGTGAVVASPRHAAPVLRTAASQPTFASHSVTVVTSTHKRLKIVVGGERNRTASSADVYLALPSRSESHAWTFGRLPTSALKVDTTGSGSMRATLPHGFGSILLTITGHGPTTTGNACGIATRAATVSGRVAFDTESSGSHKWGRFSGKLSFGTAGQVSWTTGVSGDGCGASCFPATPTGYRWSVLGENDFVLGRVTPKRATVHFDRDVKKVSGSRAISRFDQLTVRLKKRPRFARRGRTVTLSINAAGTRGAVGTAEIVGRKSVSSFACGADKTERMTDWVGTYTPGRTAFAGHPQVFGPLREGKAPGVISRDEIVDAH